MYTQNITSGADIKYIFLPNEIGKVLITVMNVYFAFFCSFFALLASFLSLQHGAALILIVHAGSEAALTHALNDY